MFVHWEEGNASQGSREDRDAGILMSVGMEDEPLVVWRAGARHKLPA